MCCCSLFDYYCCGRAMSWFIRLYVPYYDKLFGYNNDNVHWSRVSTNTNHIDNPFQWVFCNLQKLYT
ncbi:hypothetical protein VN97_g3535 [Penicillium thymicola]|uniref:Uncharacterized protein n=1 Tax=Penicillium thymicola TaxID=293382 RepID=A0AAI9XAQ3_PENTH|nr:hypothetical protein VN97_g3535 [Penicillium thymicola]